jgi:hypothetical protein
MSEESVPADALSSLTAFPSFWRRMAAGAELKQPIRPGQGAPK